MTTILKEMRIAQLSSQNEQTLGTNYKVSDHKNYNTELVKVSDNYKKTPFDMKLKKRMKWFW